MAVSSLSIFFLGVSLKTIVFVSEASYALKHDANQDDFDGCQGEQGQGQGGEGQGGGDGGGGRRLLASEAEGEWSPAALDALLFKAFLLLAACCSAAMASSMLVG